MRVFQIELEISHRADSKTVTGLVTLHKAAITPRLRNIRAETNDLALQMTHYQSHKRFVYRVIQFDLVRDKNHNARGRSHNACV
jgi:hypothetical protein